MSTEGPDDAANAQLAFTPPAQTSLQSFNGPPGWSCTLGPTVTCTNAAFPPGTDVFFSSTVVANGVANGTILTATATVSSTTTDPNPDDNDATFDVTVQSAADLAVDKSGPATVIAGDTFDYTITLQNNGPNTADDVTLTDTLDANVTFDSILAPAGWTCGHSSGVVTCTNPSLAAGTTTFTLTVQVAQISGGSITNDVDVSTTSTDNVLPNNQDSVTSNVITRADLSVTKSGPASVAPNSDLTYTIVVTNNGPSNAQNVTLTDVLPQSFVSINPPAGWNCTTGGTVTCSTATLLSGASANFTLTLHVSPSTPLGTSIANTAQVASATTDPNSSNDSDTETTPVRSAATLSATKTITSGTPTAGTNVTYDVVITNNGPSMQFDNPGNEMLDQLPAGLTLLSASATSGTAVADIPNNRVTWNGSIANGGSVTVTITARLDTINAANQATVNYDADGNGTNESSANSNVAAFALSPATLSVTKSIVAGAPAQGTNVTYDVVITNNGPSTQLDNPGDEMEDQLPPGLTLISATATSGTAVADIPNNRVTWNGSIANGGTVTVTIVARLDDVNAANRATVHFDADGNGTNESSATSNAAAFAAPIPSLTAVMLAMLAAMLAFVAMRRL